ncbi:MAG: hypothetical protein WC405_07100 [Syntrophales bacterium]
MSKYKTGQEIIQEWKIKDFELFEQVKAGLQPFNQLGKPLPPPDIAATINRINKLESELKRLSYKGSLSATKEALSAEKEMIIQTPRQNGSPLEQGKRAKEIFRLMDIMNAEKKLDRLPNEIKALKRALKRINNENYWINYELPEDNGTAKQVINSLLNAFFKMDEISGILDNANREDQSPEQYTNKEVEQEADFPLSVVDYITRRRSEDTKDEMIAYELHDEKGSFQLTYVEVAHELGLDKGLNKDQHAARKQRGKRACDKGKDMLFENKKRKEP